MERRNLVLKGEVTAIDMDSHSASLEDETVRMRVHLGDEVFHSPGLESPNTGWKCRIRPHPRPTGSEFAF